jgi:hypothetical protein
MRSGQVQYQSLLLRVFPFSHADWADTIKLQTKECKNNLSARVQETVVSELIDKELQKGFIYGPFTHPPFDNYRVSPIAGFPHSFCE